MIENERQFAITNRRLRELRKVIKEFDIEESSARIGSDVLARAELEALRSEEEVLASQVLDYVELKSGKITILEAPSLEELPGVLIRARIANGLSQRRLAELVGLKEQQIQRYEAGDYSSASLRRLLEIAEALKLRITEFAQIVDDNDLQNTKRSKELDWTKFPVKEMYKRRWFAAFSGSLDEALLDAEELVRDYVTNIMQKPAFAMHRKRLRTGTIVNEYCLIAWQCRVIDLARKAGIKNNYRPELITSDWIAELAKASARDDGPVYARSLLRELGIALVIEPQLSNTHLDGAAILYEHLPIIGLTLRYDRLDNFWFVLFHEIYHVLKHLRKGSVESVFDDLDFTGNDNIEDEADAQAGDALIPKASWQHALVRFVRSPAAAIGFANQLHISPAIIAGRIRHEANNYYILNDLVGQGNVRKQFPEVNFGV